MEKKQFEKRKDIKKQNKNRRRSRSNRKRKGEIRKDKEGNYDIQEEVEEEIAE